MSLWSPFVAACAVHDPALFDAEVSFIPAQALLTLWDPETGDTALHAAAGAGNVHAVNRLLAAGVGPNAVNKRVRCIHCVPCCMVGVRAL